MADHERTTTIRLRDVLPAHLCREWISEQNRALDSAVPTRYLDERVFWRCATHPSHIWQASTTERLDGAPCPHCRLTSTPPSHVPGSLQDLHPDLVQFWHPLNNHPLTPSRVSPYSPDIVQWTCPANDAHTWQTSVAEYVQKAREGSHCPICENGWSTDTLRLFIQALQPHLDELTSSELYLIAQQAGLMDLQGDSRTVVNAILDKTAASQDLEHFIHRQQSTRSLAQQLTRQGLTRDQHGLPQLTTFDILTAYENPMLPIQDRRAIAYLLESGVQKLWRKTIEDEAGTLASIEAFQDSGYATQVKQQFLSEYRAATHLTLPEGYAFQIDGQSTLPNLMQKLIAVRVRDRHRTGNWAGTGSGKTLSGCLASRVINARVTLILAPNNVIPVWEQCLRTAFPDSVILTRTLSPAWPGSRQLRYLIIHYELLQQPDSEINIRHFLTGHPDLDFIVIDEQHMAKVRYPSQLSLRRTRLNLLTLEAAQQNPALHLLVMSATPILNSLEEARSTLELVHGISLPHLDTKPTLANAMRIHQEMTLAGFRWLPTYQIQYCEHKVPIDCTAFLPRLLALPKKAGILKIEQLLLEARLQTVLDLIEPKTMIYTSMIDGIVEPLAQAIAQRGFTVGLFTGDQKDGSAEFLADRLDVLIVSDVAAVGVDGFQRICHRLICLNTPWTASMFFQLLGRLYRQGQPHHRVDLFLPIATVTIGDSTWSWDRAKLERINFKKTLADAAIDGIIPTGELQNPQQAYQYLMGWLARLSESPFQQGSDA